MAENIFVVRGNTALNEWHVFKNYDKAYAWCMGERVPEKQIITIPMDSRGRASLYAIRGY